jgi:SAM-dependent methyltransferase
VQFIANNIIEAELPEAGFDLIYSRDAIMYNNDKAAIFTRLRSLLAPSGQLFISDYGSGPDPLSQDFTDYVAETGYYLLQADEYAETLEEAGFTQAVATDKTGAFIEILESELLRLAEVCAGPKPALEEDDRDFLHERWTHKIDWCKAGHMRWLHLRANA